MLLSFYNYFLLFIIYSILGWAMEVISVSIQNKRIVNRGFLIGPYCPIYGLGALFIILLLGRYKYDPLVLFVMTVVTCGILEYLTSWTMEVLFKARWWDYSKEKFNLNGRVCLKNLVWFGILGLFITYILNPFFISLIGKLSYNVLKWTAISIFVLFIIDGIMSFIVIFNFRKITKKVNQEKREDNTEEITKMVRQIFAQKSFFNRRFINAYPKLEAIKMKVKEIQVKIKKNVNEVKDNINEKRQEIKNTIEKTTRKTKVQLYLRKKNLKHTFRRKEK